MTLTSIAMLFPFWAIFFVVTTTAPTWWSAMWRNTIIALGIFVALATAATNCPTAPGCHIIEGAGIALPWAWLMFVIVMLLAPLIRVVDEISFWIRKWIQD